MNPYSSGLEVNPSGYRFFGGIDPDLHSTGIAFLCSDVSVVGNPTWLYFVGCVKNKGKTHQSAVIAMGKALKKFFIFGGLPDDCLAFATEAQELYLGGTKNPRSILWLANTAGSTLQSALFRYPKAEHYFPRPAEWKGQLPKHVKQGRIFKGLGIQPQEIKGSITKGTAYVLPDLASYPHIVKGTDEINPGDWKHIGDAVGLALFAQQQLYQAQRTLQIRKNRA